jgi:hypothetical protein
VEVVEEMVVDDEVVDEVAEEVALDEVVEEATDAVVAELSLLETKAVNLHEPPHRLYISPAQAELQSLDGMSVPLAFC